MHRIICTCTHSTGLRIRPGLYLSSPSIHPYSTLNQISVAASTLHSAPVTDHERWCRHRYNITTTLHIGCCGAVDVCTPLLLCSRIVAKVRLINFTFIFHSFIVIHPSLLVLPLVQAVLCLSPTHSLDYPLTFMRSYHTHKKRPPLTRFWSIEYDPYKFLRI